MLNTCRSLRSKQNTSSFLVWFAFYTLLQAKYFRIHSVEFFVRMLLKSSIFVLVRTKFLKASLYAIGLSIIHSTLRFFNPSISYMISFSFSNLLSTKDKQMQSFGMSIPLIVVSFLESYSTESAEGGSPYYFSLTMSSFLSKYLVISLTLYNIGGFYYNSFLSSGYRKVMMWSRTQTFCYFLISLSECTSKLPKSWLSIILK